MKLNFELLSYGPITIDFKGFAQLEHLKNKIKSGIINQHRIDCYPITNKLILKTKFSELGLPFPEDIEVFYPSKKYPPHVDEGGLSYFIPLEKGVFTINGVNYPIVPFVLYAFDDGKLHNSNFCSIMLK